MRNEVLVTTACPECGQVAEVERHDVDESTEGPVVMVYVRCLDRHWFLMPEEKLPAQRPVPEGRSRARDAVGLEVRFPYWR